MWPLFGLLLTHLHSCSTAATLEEEEVFVVDLTGRLRRSTIKIMSSGDLKLDDLKLDFSTIESPHHKTRDTDVLSPQGAWNTRDTAVENEPDEPLYNTQIYGGLRKGDTVKFFSIQCIGLVAATFSSTFAVECSTARSSLCSRSTSG